MVVRVSVGKNAHAALTLPAAGHYACGPAILRRFIGERHPMKIGEYLLQTLECCGVSRVFGNPGTTEIPLMRLFEGRTRSQYVVALSEVAAVPMADGYARATRSLGVVNLHVAPGLGNGMGTLYTARIAKTPLLVLVGAQDRRLAHTRPLLHGPLEAMAASVCKTVLPLTRRAQALADVRNAVRAALTPPYAPVALILPPDLLEQECDGVPAAVRPARLGVLPDAELDRLAAALRASASPAFVAAEEVHWHAASAPLRALAEKLGAPVYAAPYTGVLPLDCASNAFAGYLSPNFAAISDRLRAHDLVLFAGGAHLRTTLYSEMQLPQPAYWLGDDPALLPPAGDYTGSHLVDLEQTLAALHARVEAMAEPHAQTPHRWRGTQELPPSPADSLHPTHAVHALLGAFPDALLFDEAGLSTSDIRQWMRCRAGEYFTNGSGGIGWGLAAAVGGAIGRPERQVVAVIGDGSSLYASEALWSAAHHGTSLLLVVLTNRRYATLNAAAGKLAAGALEAFSLEPPALDFAGLAALHRWSFVRARTQSELAQTLQRWQGRVTENTLLELVLDPDVLPVTASRHF
jgi:benzoylformate decarboxylase